jgi:hypothetical protein
MNLITLVLTPVGLLVMGFMILVLCAFAVGKVNEKFWGD